MENFIGKRIKLFRIEKKLSRKDLSQKLEISIHTLTKYEQGQRKPNIEILINISIILNISLDNLVKSNLLKKESLNSNFEVGYLLKEYEILVSYLRESNFNEDGLPSNDDTYYKVIRIPAHSREEAFNNVENFIFGSKNLCGIEEDYVEGTLEIEKMLSIVGHTATQY